MNSEEILTPSFTGHQKIIIPGNLMTPSYVTPEPKVKRNRLRVTKKSESKVTKKLSGKAFKAKDLICHEVVR